MTQPPAYPPPGPPGMMPVQRKSTTTRTILIIVAAVVLFCCIGLAGAGIWLFVATKNAVGPAKNTAVSFVEDLESNNAGSAYNRLCPSVRNKLTREDFIAGVASQPPIASHKVTGVDVHSDNGITTADIRMDLTGSNGETAEHTFPMVKVGGTWYVCGNPY